MPSSCKKIPLTEIRKVARERFGYRTLKPGHEEVIRLLLGRHDTLSVMPTRFGKSAIYQSAELFIKGPSVVVPYPLNERVEYKKFGAGTVMRYEDEGAETEKVVVLFDTEGYKSIVIRVARENNLMQLME